MDTTNSRSCRSWWRNRTFRLMKRLRRIRERNQTRWRLSKAATDGAPNSSPSCRPRHRSAAAQSPRDHTQRHTSAPSIRPVSRIRILPTWTPVGNTQQKQIQKLLHTLWRPNLRSTRYMHYSHGGKKPTKKFQMRTRMPRVMRMPRLKDEETDIQKKIKRERERENISFWKESRLFWNRKRKIERSNHGALGYWECQSR